MLLREMMGKDGVEDRIWSPETGRRPTVYEATVLSIERM